MRPFEERVFVKLRPSNWSRIKAAVEHLWSVYSKATPKNGTEVLLLLLLCFAVAMATSILLFTWMAQSLSYGAAASSTAACTCSTVTFFLLFLIHPFRCVFTMALPTLGTKQGRKLILSTSVMLLVLSVLPNIAANVGVTSHVLRCTAGELAESLINSSEVMNRVKAELVNKVQNVGEGDLQFVGSLRNFNHCTYINMTKVKQRFTGISQSIKREFSHATHILKEIKLVANRIIALFFVIYLFVESVSYLKSYLIDLKFDNKNFAGQLDGMACDSGIHTLPCHVKNVFIFKHLRISRQELLRCVPRIMLVSLYFTLTVFVISLDYIVHRLVSESKPWVLNIPPTSIHISVAYKVQSYVPGICLFTRSCGAQVLVDFRETYPWTVRSRPEHCSLVLSEPDQGVVCLLLLLYLVAYSMVFFEVYARRSRRAVCASFFKWQEVKRVTFLHQHTLAKQEQTRIFAIDTHESGGSTDTECNAV